MYSPKIDPELIGKLYHVAKAQGVPMTKLTNNLLRESLSRMEMTAVTHERRPFATIENNSEGRNESFFARVSSK